MKFENIFFYIRLFIMCCFIPCFAQKGPIFGNNMSPAELEKLEQELAQAAQEIDKYVASLSPEEQAQFNQAVKEVESMLENMTPEEFEMMMNEMMQAVPQNELISQPEVIATPTITPEEEKKEEISPIDLKKQSSLLSLLDSLIKLTNEFLVKVHSIPEIIANVERWAEQDMIQYWKKDESWKDFEFQIDLLNQRLHIMRTKKGTDNSFVFIKDLIENEKLVAHLKKLEQKLEATISKIETSNLLQNSKMSLKSKQSAQEAITAYAQSFYFDNVLEEIDKLFQKYDPLAKKIKESEKQFELNAQKRQGLPSYTSNVLIGGKERPQDNLNQDFPMDYPSSVYNDYYPSDYRSNYINNNPEQELTGEDKKIKPESTSPAPTSSTGTKKEKDKKDSKISLPAAERLMVQIELSFSGIKNFILENVSLQDIKKHLLSSEQPVDPLLNQYALSTLDKKINELISLIKALDRKTRDTEGAQDHYKKELIDIYNEFKAIPEKLSHDLQYIQQNWEIVQKGISEEKKRVYFLKETDKKNSIKEKREITEPATKEEQENKVESVTVPYPTELNLPEDFGLTLTEEQKDQLLKARAEFAANYYKEQADKKVSTQKNETEKNQDSKEKVELDLQEQVPNSQTLFSIIDSINKLHNAVKEFGIKKR